MLQQGSPTEFSTMDGESKNKEVSTSPSNDQSGAVPSGFILKLYQMVNGAPDEVISVSFFHAFRRKKKSEDTHFSSA
jgi:hypothetical protein